ncbi:uncharacterized protein LOC111117719 [Crassostrea virginica]
MSEIQDSVEDTSTEHETIEMLRTWKMDQLKEWLLTRGLKRSGKKEVLVKRVYRVMQSGDDSSSDSASESDLDDTPCVTPINEVTEPWKDISVRCLPPLHEKDIDNYFIYQKNPTSGKKARFQRHMKKAQKFAAEGYIYNIFYNAVSENSDYCYIKSNCKPSMKIKVSVGNLGKVTDSYSLHVCLVKETGKIESAYCDCKAGECGLCAHAGALMYTVSKVKNACTSQECQWNRPRSMKKKPDPLKVIDIQLSENERCTGKPYPDVYQAGPCKDPDQFLQDLMSGMDEVNPRCVLYQTLACKPADISSFLSTYEVPSEEIPDDVDLNTVEYQQKFREFMENLTLSSNTCENLEIGTRGQSINNNWIEARNCLITASEMGDVCKRKTKCPDALVRRLMGYTQPPKQVKSLTYGRSNEKKGIKAYVKEHSSKCGKENVKYCTRGLHVNPKYPFLGASADGLIHCERCGTGLVEVKCPYGRKESQWRNMTPNECAQDISFCCELSDLNNLSLKLNHNYMYQVQGQLALYELEWVDFVVWTKKGCNVQRIPFDANMWAEMLVKLKKFYVTCVIPELFTRRIKKGKPLNCF